VPFLDCRLFCACDALGARASGEFLLTTNAGRETLEKFKFIAYRIICELVALINLLAVARVSESAI
jgi:hypothetical protein